VPDSATLVAILTSLGVGGLIGAWANAIHERSEKFRDRTIDASLQFLQKVDAARRELQAAQVSLSASTSTTKPLTQSAALKLLEKPNEAWRELQAHTFLLALLLPGGEMAPAAQDAMAVATLYYRWRNALYDYATGKLDAEAMKEIAASYSELAVDPYNLFTEHTNEAIRPYVFVRPRRLRWGREKGFPMEAIDDLESYLDTVRAESGMGDLPAVDPKTRHP
jgi:hypothetical protein